MRPRFRWIILGLGIAILLGLAGFKVWQRRQDELQITLVDKNATEAATRLRDLQAQVRAREARRQRQLTEVEAARVTAAQARAASEAGASEVARHETNRFVGGVHLHYLPLFRRLGLSPAQVAKFEAILDDSRQRSDDLRIAAQSQGMKFNDPSIQAIEDQERARMQIQLTDLLGPQAYQQFDDYARADAIRDLTTALAGQLYAGDTPLTATQGDRLTAILATLSPEYQKGLKITNLAAMDWDAVFAQTRGALSPLQESALEHAVDLVQTETQIHAMVRALKAQAAANPAAGP